MNDEDIYDRASRLSRQGVVADENKLQEKKKNASKKLLGVYHFFSRIFFYFICSFFALIGIGGACFFIILYLINVELPNHNTLKNYNPNISTRVFLQDGSKLCEYSDEKRYFIPIDLVPDKVINAFIAVEDKHFFKHFGIDVYGIFRSLLTNLKRIGTGQRPQGASTITQQVARIFLIKSNEVSYIRKLKEAILAYRIENTLSKKQILELYLNQIYLGLSAYGIVAAAKTYFDKTINELTISECAYLAILAKGANNYHPEKHKNKAISRRNWALGRMLEDGYITKIEYEKAVHEDLLTVKQNRNGYLAEYFSEELRKDIKSKYPNEILNKEGMIVRATLDSNLQYYAYYALKKGIENVDRRFGWRGAISHIQLNQDKNKILSILKSINLPKGGENFLKAVFLGYNCKILLENKSISQLTNEDLKWAKNLKAGDVILVEKEKNRYLLKQIPEVQGAIIVMDVHNGRILAMQGGYSFAQSEFNRVTQAKRQIGSAFKPFVYLAGLDNGFAPNSIIDASPLEIDLGGGQGIWRPRNYRGAILDKITFRQAIERSVNTATIRIAKEVGMTKIAKIATDFGLFEEMPEYLSYALGAGETTLLKLVTAYAMLANGGKKIEPIMIDYIFDKNGKVIYKSDIRELGNNDNEYPPHLIDMRPQILNEQSIYQLTSLLEGVIQRGSGVSARFLNFPIAGKTGTSNESKDTWFVAYTPDIAIGVFIGFDDHTKSLGKNASGATTALPIFINFMQNAKKLFVPKPFKVPKGIKLRKIDLVTGTNPKGNIDIIEAFKQNEEINDDILETPYENNSDLIDNSKTDNYEIKQVFGIY